MTNIMDELMDQAIAYRDQVKRGARSFLDNVLAAMTDDELEIALERTFKVLRSADLENAQAASVARRVATAMANVAGIKADDPKPVIRAGIEILNWYAKLGVIDAEKRKQIQEAKGGNRTVNVWFLKWCVDIPEDDELIYCDPRQPYIPWVGPTRYDSGTTIPIVKRAEQHGLLQEYTMDKIPMLYQALNRIGMAKWEINIDLYKYALACKPDNSPRPDMPSDEDVGRAHAILRNVKSSKAKRMAANKTMGAQEKAKTFKRVMKYARAYRKYELQFPHNLCGRGRIYSLSPVLNPQGADIAKALLVMTEKRPMVRDEFFIHTANCAGVDKLTYADRIQWVDDNYHDLVCIGRDPIAAWPMIQDLGVHKEKKTYYQFIACCIELYKWSQNPNHETGMLLGLDSTSSGNQILAMLARDHEVAEYVNISMTQDGAPGDLYAYVGKFVREGLQDLTMDDLSPKMVPHVKMDNIKALAALPKGHKTFRKITKRICMVLPYSGTRFGAGEITKDDQFDHGSDEMDNLNFADCSAVGGVIYDQCVIAAKRSMDLMAYMRDNLSTHEVVVTWRVPHTNFLAFQSKEAMTQSSVSGRIGNKDVSLNVFLPTGRGNLMGHRNAISPGMVHSLDAAMLAMIINGIPMDIPVSAIHDQFCVPFGHMDILVRSARNAYAAVADRDAFQALATSAFGHEVELPEPGKWRLDELGDSDYFVC